MAYTPTTWVTGDTVTATKMNKLEQGVANAGGGYDFVITGEYVSDDFDNLTLESGSYSGLVAMLQNGIVPSGVIYIDYDDGTRIGLLATIKDLSADDMVACAFIGYTPVNDTVDLMAFVIGSDGSVNPD